MRHGDFPIYSKLPLKVEDNLVLNLTESSISYDNGCYKVAIPWKEEFINLPNNYEMAELEVHGISL